MPKTPDVAETLASTGAEPGGLPSAEFGRHLRAAMLKWGNVVRAAGIRPD